MRNNNSVKLQNIKMLEFVAIKLEEARHDVVFLGGCTTAIFISEQQTPDVRYTLDVDCIVDVISLSAYHDVERVLREKGFKQSLTEGVICRWFYDDVILDIVPADESVLGFGNRWYKQAILSAMKYQLTDNIDIRVVTAPYFLATKFEAFKSRGKMDFYASHDFEDIVSVLDGRFEIVEEIKNADSDLKEYLIENISQMLNSSSFKGAIPGHFVQYGTLADDRVELFEQKLISIMS